MATGFRERDCPVRKNTPSSSKYTVTTAPVSRAIEIPSHQSTAKPASDEKRPQLLKPGPSTYFREGLAAQTGRWLSLPQVCVASRTRAGRNSGTHAA